MRLLWTKFVPHRLTKQLIAYIDSIRYTNTCLSLLKFKPNE